MSTLGLAGNLIGWSGWPLNLNYGHFQVVHVSDTGEEEEIEVLPSRPQVQSTLPPTGKSFWTYPDDGAPSNHEVDAPVNYKFTPIDFGRSADSAWGILKQVHEQFTNGGTDIQYQFDKNTRGYRGAVQCLGKHYGADVP